MGKATSMLLAAIGIGTATYLTFVPDRDQAASDKLASLVRIAADGSRAVSASRTEREATRDSASPKFIADKETLGAGHKPPEPGRINLAQAPNAERGQVAPPTPSAAESGQRRSSVKPVDDESRRSLSRSIQVELKRVGCLDSEPDGVWNSSTRNALKTFIERINASLPVNEPDYILLTLLQGHTNRVCGKGCPTGQVLANDGRCQPKVIVAQAERKVPRREQPKGENADGGQRVATAQVAPDVFERERQAQTQATAQVKAAEAARAKFAMEDARQRQEQLAKAEAERMAKSEAERVAQAKTAAAADEARQKQVAVLAEQQRQKDDAQRVAAARAAEQQHLKVEAALAETRRMQAALDEQQRVAAVAGRRAAEEQRSKAAAAEDGRRKQLIADEQKRGKAEAERLAAARAEEDARIKAAAAAEGVRRKQLVADEQKRSKAEAERLAAARFEEQQRIKAVAAAEETRRKQLAAEMKVAQPPVAGNDPTRVAVATAQVMQPQILANVNPNNAAASVQTAPASMAMESVPFTTSSTNVPVAAAPVAGEPAVVLPAPGKKKPVQPARRPEQQGRQDGEPEPQAQRVYVQRFVPPPTSYVGRVQQAPAPRPVYYQAPQNWRNSVFNGLARNAP